MTVAWRDLPPKPNNGGSRRSEEWTVIAAQLREHPGSWAVVKTARTRSNAGRIADEIKTAKNAAFTPAGAFDAAVRKGESGEFEIYARKT